MFETKEESSLVGKDRLESVLSHKSKSHNFRTEDVSVIRRRVQTTWDESTAKW